VALLHDRIYRAKFVEQFQTSHIQSSKILSTTTKLDKGEFPLLIITGYAATAWGKRWTSGGSTEEPRVWVILPPFQIIRHYKNLGESKDLKFD
jgi:hypothetical protein